MRYAIDWLLAALTTVLRFGCGLRASAAGPRPTQPPLLYEFEGCPYCRKAREAVTALDLTVDVRPCPKRGERYRPELVARGGKAQFPYLVDPDTGEERYESSAIIAALFARYGAGRRPLILLLGPVGDVLSQFAQLPRIGAGTHARRSRAPETPLTLYASEGSPAGRLVRERLAELELPYRLHPTGFGSIHREGLRRRFGRVAPVLEDPDAGIEIQGGRAILAHLASRYAA